MEDNENTLVDIPVTQEQMERDAFLHDEELTLEPGTVVIRPGDQVDVLYQLVRGQIDMVRNLGRGDEGRKTFTCLPGRDRWTPRLGGRYLFTKRPSSQHYVAMTRTKVRKITPETIRGALYLSGQCVQLVRDLLRCSDMERGSFLHKELEKRYEMFAFPGFRLDDPDHLLTASYGDVVRGGETDSHLDAIKDGVKLMDSEYVNYARAMIRLLMGMDEDGGEHTSLGENIPNIRT